MVKLIPSIIVHAAYGSVCIQLTHFSYDDCGNTCSYNHQIGSVTHLLLFMARLWNNGRRCIYFYIMNLWYGWIAQWDTSSLVDLVPLWWLTPMKYLFMGILFSWFCVWEGFIIILFAHDQDLVSVLTHHPPIQTPTPLHGKTQNVRGLSDIRFPIWIWIRRGSLDWFRVLPLLSFIWILG